MPQYWEIGCVENDIVWETVLACWIWWNNEQSTASKTVLFRCPASLCLEDLLVIPVVSFDSSLGSNVACLLWFNYSPYFCSLFWRHTLSQVTWLQLIQKRPQCVFSRFVLPVWFAVLRHCCLNPLVGFSCFHIPGRIAVLYTASWLQWSYVIFQFFLTWQTLKRKPQCVLWMS